MKYVHFVLQGKGGAGKSFIASIIAQYIKDLDKDNLVLDTDPLNQSLHKIKGIESEFINILDINREDIDHKQFDIIMEKIIGTDATHTVIDTGSNSFLQLCNYIKRQKIIASLYGFGFQTKFHFVINGGSEQNEAIKLMTEFSAVLYDIVSLDNDFYDTHKPLVIWLNPMPAPLKFNNQFDSIYHDPCYLLMDSLIDGIIHIPKYHSDGLLKHDVFAMRDNLLTFAEFLQQPYDTQKGLYGIISKQRIVNYRRQMYQMMTPIFAD